MVQKKAAEAKEKPKKLRFWVILLAVLVLLLIIGGIVRHSIDNEFHYEGWIDCMPPLDVQQAELCRRAEQAGYDKIAY